MFLPLPACSCAAPPAVPIEEIAVGDLIRLDDDSVVETDSIGFDAGASDVDNAEEAGEDDGDAQSGKDDDDDDENEVGVDRGAEGSGNGRRVDVDPGDALDALRDLMMKKK